jgi:hypothetical protein
MYGGTQETLSNLIYTCFLQNPDRLEALPCATIRNGYVRSRISQEPTSPAIGIDTRVKMRLAKTIGAESDPPSHKFSGNNNQIKYVILPCDNEVQAPWQAPQAPQHPWAMAWTLQLRDDSRQLNNAHQSQHQNTAVCA